MSKSNLQSMKSLPRREIDVNKSEKATQAYRTAQEALISDTYAQGSTLGSDTGSYVG